MWSIQLSIKLDSKGTFNKASIWTELNSKSWNSRGWEASTIRPSGYLDLSVCVVQMTEICVQYHSPLGRLLLILLLIDDHQAIINHCTAHPNARRDKWWAGSQWDCSNGVDMSTTSLLRKWITHVICYRLHWTSLGSVVQWYLYIDKNKGDEDNLWAKRMWK